MREKIGLLAACCTAVMGGLIRGEAGAGGTGGASGPANGTGGAGGTGKCKKEKIRRTKSAMLWAALLVQRSF